MGAGCVSDGWGVGCVMGGVSVGCVMDVCGCGSDG